MTLSLATMLHSEFPITRYLARQLSGVETWQIR
jgi:hypothetical protein